MSVNEKSVLQLRTQEKIQQILLEMFRQSDLNINGKKFFISVTNVDISPNLRNLKVFIDIINMEQKDKEKVVKNLNRENVYAVKGLIAKKINLRYVPEVIFTLDDSGEKTYKINKIIEKEAGFFKENKGENE